MKVQPEFQESDKKKKIKRIIKLKEFELDKPGNYESLIQNADGLFAELLIKVHLNKLKKSQEKAVS